MVVLHGCEPPNVLPSPQPRRMQPPRFVARTMVAPVFFSSTLLPVHACTRVLASATWTGCNQKFLLAASRRGVQTPTDPGCQGHPHNDSQVQRHYVKHLLKRPGVVRVISFTHASLVTLICACNIIFGPLETISTETGGTLRHCTEFICVCNTWDNPTTATHRARMSSQS
jgi:hypothetical protein